jgi:hypothetical protein
MFIFVLGVAMWVYSIRPDCESFFKLLTNARTCILSQYRSTMSSPFDSRGSTRFRGLINMSHQHHASYFQALDNIIHNTPLEGILNFPNQAAQQLHLGDPSETLDLVSQYFNQTTVFLLLCLAVIISVVLKIANNVNDVSDLTTVP